MINLLLIGRGNWSQNYQRTLQQFPNIHLTIAGKSDWQEKSLQLKYDGVIICTPPNTHVALALAFLKNNIPVMIEKPLALSLNECQKLQGFDAPILVNHQHLFAQDYQHIKQTILPNQIISIDSIGTSNHEPRHGYSELFDYGPHDISMILDLAQQFPIEIKCQAVSDRRLFIIELQFEHFKTSSVVGHTEFKHRYFKVNNLIYDTDKTNDRPLTTSLQIFIQAIQGRKDDRLGLDLSLKIMQVLETCHNQTK